MVGQQQLKTKMGNGEAIYNSYIEGESGADS